jgi:hypothetical protein
MKSEILNHVEITNPNVLDFPILIIKSPQPPLCPKGGEGGLSALEFGYKRTTKRKT